MGGRRQPLANAALTVAVALAFADASIVVLALPPIYGELGTSIEGTAWIITIYALVVAAASGLLLLAADRVSSARVTRAGLLLFSAASVACGLAPTSTWLITGRAVQGLGAALLLSGALVELGARLGPTSGARRWGLAASAGLAAGPAIGGALTEAFDWRAIFLAQAPIAAAALILGLRSRPGDGPPEAERAGDMAAEPVGRRGLGAIALVGVSGALVGALFLGVLLIVEVWRHSPLKGALVVSALPLGLLVARVALGGLPGRVRAVAGCSGLAGGLVGLALLPAASAGWAAAALLLCGAGLGLVDPVLEHVLIGGRTRLRIGAVDVGARHAGLVLGLLLIAPTLSGDLETGAERAVLAGAETVLEARLQVADKIDLAQGLRAVIGDTEPGRMPDVGAAFEDAGLEGPDAGAAEAALVTRIEEVLTRSFRSSFLLAAALATAAVVPTAWSARSRPRRRPRPWLHPAVGWVAATAVGLCALVLPLSAWRSGGDTVGEYVEADPCRSSIDPYSGDGLDATLQRIALGGLNGAACELGLSRERLILSLAETPGFGSVELDDDELDGALEAGLLRAVDDAEDRGSLPNLGARVLRGAVRAAPLVLVLEGIERLDVLPF